MKMNLSLLCVLVFALTAAGGNAERTRGGFVEAWSDFLEDTEKVLDNMLHQNGAEEKGGNHAADNCAGCGEHARLQALRVQSVQNQILRKLRLRERPEMAAGAALPGPVAAGHTLLDPERPHHPDHDLHSDDFYGKTEQKIVFPDGELHQGKCGGGRHPTACFSFTMPRDLQPQDVSSAELWIYKESDPLDGFKQTFVVTEAAHWDYSHLHTKTRPVAITETDLIEGWLKAEVGWAVGLWLEEGRSALAVACPSCGASPARAPLALLGAKRPFLVINTKHSAKKRRVRQLECTEGVSECCRERLYVSFAELGWDDWILQPRGYHAYFCRGACSSVAAVTLSGSHHHSVIKKLFHSSAGASRRVELKPCCTPTTFSPMQLFYRDSNFTVTQTTLPNMIVESCGCM